MNDYLDCLRRYASFTGRSSLRQFWSFMAVLVAAVFVGAFIDGVAGRTGGGGIVTTLVGLAHVIPAWAVTARRLHDTGRSGWLALLSLLPLIGAIIVIVLCCGPSQPGPNQFGDPPATDVATKHRDTYRQVHLPVEPSMDGTARHSAVQRYPVAAAAITEQSTDPSLMVERLEKLARLRASGTIDDAEFTTMKAALLGGKVS